MPDSDDTTYRPGPPEPSGWNLIDPASTTAAAPQKGPSMREIAATICERDGLTMAEILKRKRTRRIAWPRQDAMRAMRMAGFTFHQIAQFFDLDHTSVVYGDRQSRLRRT